MKKWMDLSVNKTKKDQAEKKALETDIKGHVRFLRKFKDF